MKTYNFLLLAIAMIFATFAGCGGPKIVSVKGVATAQGKPVPHLIIHFSPVAGRPSSALTDENGCFELEFDRKLKGAAVGTHKVTVTVAPRDPAEEEMMAMGHPPRDPIRAAIAAKFAKQDAAPLSVTITKAEAAFDLKFD